VSNNLEKVITTLKEYGFGGQSIEHYMHNIQRGRDFNKTNDLKNVLNKLMKK
jgi:hypothetical protein